MEALLFMLLIVAALALLSGAFRTPPPQIIYVQPVAPAPVRGNFGYLLWMVGILVLLLVLGVVKL